MTQFRLFFANAEEKPRADEKANRWIKEKGRTVQTMTDRERLRQNRIPHQRGSGTGVKGARESMKRTLDNCTLIKKCVKAGLGEPKQFRSIEQCEGYQRGENDDEPCEQCKKCRYCTSREE